MNNKGFNKVPLPQQRAAQDAIAKRMGVVIDPTPTPSPSPSWPPPSPEPPLSAFAIPLNLSTWIDDPMIDSETPDVGAIDGGGALFYRGRINEVHGEPGIGKSNVNLAVAVDVLNRGGRVIYVDPEDHPRSIVVRLLSFGAEKEAIRSRFHYFHNPEPSEIPGIITFANHYRPDLVVIDGLAEIVAAHGFSEDKSEDMITILKDVVRPFTESGAAVVVSDHVTKSAEGRGRHPRGSGAKLGRYDGAVYEVRLGRGYGPGREGWLTLHVCKDRNGGVGPVGSKVAEIIFTPEDTVSRPCPEVGTRFKTPCPEDTVSRPCPGPPRTRVSIVRSKFADGSQDGGPWRPTAIMEKVSRALELSPNLSKRELRASIGGKASYVDTAIRCLVEDGCLVERSTNGGRTIRRELLKPYRQVEPEDKA